MHIKLTTHAFMTCTTDAKTRMKCRGWWIPWKTETSLKITAYCCSTLWILVDL